MKRNYTLKVKRGGKMVSYIRTHSIRRFLNKTRLINWEDGLPEVYLRVSYGRERDVFGTVQTFYNDGTYDNPADFKLALEAFLEEE